MKTRSQGRKTMQTQHVTTPALSWHCQTRIRQRGLTEEDIELVVTWGEVVDDGYVVTNKVLEACHSMAGAKARRLERLSGVAVIEINGVFVTAYRADKWRIRRLRRGPVKPAVERRHRRTRVR
jgi:hypothetical protein